MDPEDPLSLDFDVAIMTRGLQAEVERMKQASAPKREAGIDAETLGNAVGA
jgi:hypothetical protein